jgi:hypothetical protein
MELQAINRVHRIGQTRPTFVHKFMIRDTVEEKMFAMQHDEYVMPICCTALGLANIMPFFSCPWVYNREAARMSRANGAAPAADKVFSMSRLNGPHVCPGWIACVPQPYMHVCTLQLQDTALEGHEAGAQRLVTAEAPSGDLVATLLSQCLGTSSALPPDTQAE